MGQGTDKYIFRITGDYMTLRCDLSLVFVVSLYLEPYFAHSEAARHSKSHGVALLSGACKEHR